MAQIYNRKSTSKRRIAGWLWGVLALLLVAVLAFAAWRLAAVPQTTAYPAEISVEQAAEKREAGAFILDVRQPEEWNEFHIAEATLIPLAELEARIDEIPRDQEVVVVCRTGNRSATGREILREAGFEQVASMAGGMVDWQAAGYPTISGP